MSGRLRNPQSEGCPLVSDKGGSRALLEGRRSNSMVRPSSMNQVAWMTEGGSQGQTLNGPGDRRLKWIPSNLAAVAEIAVRNQEILVGVGLGVQRIEEGLRKDA